MKVTYLGHSGFLVETEKAYYLFDYIRGELPEWNTQKPLYVFVSHSHADHFSEKVFASDIAAHVTAYILSYDIRKKFHNKRTEWLREYSEKIDWAEPEKKLELPECAVLFLKSTDIGVAFVVEEDKTTIYHAGDLNWWHWEGEAKAWNRNMEVNYKRQLEHLREKKITLAFVVLDPRQGEAYWYGMDYFWQITDTKIVFPMHFWEENAIIDRYIAEHGNGQNVMKIGKEGLQYEV